MRRALVLCLLCLALPLAAYATPYISPEEAMLIPDRDVPFVRALPPVPSAFEYDALYRFEMCADFITTMQVSDTAEASYGGMREGEHMLNVIQTDNTSEALWIWTRYYALTGTDAYHDNIDAAWEYCMNHLAYNEEGDTDPVSGYYRVYNCAWAVRAEMEYRQVYGDSTYASYADSCASYLWHNPLKMNGLIGFNRRLNGMVMSWAVGNLYEYGSYTGNPTLMSNGVNMADSIKSWAEANPNKFHWQEWAMEGGSVMWGIVHSYFADDPTGLETWVESYAPYLATEVTSGTYQNAWRAWAALGQSTASEVLGSGIYGAYFKHLADTLVANDGDSDGGIPVTDGEPDDQDQSWVTNYLGFMCMDRILVTAGLPLHVASEDSRLEVSVQPTPCTGFPRLVFNLERPSDIAVRLFDVSGRLLTQRDASLFSSGLQSMSLGGDQTGETVSPGVYFYVLEAGRKVAKGKIVVVR